MLEIQKSTALSGSIKIGERVALTLNANITPENSGNTSINQYIVDQELYSANRKECRENINQFYEEVYKVEDAFLEEQAKKETSK